MGKLARSYAFHNKGLGCVLDLENQRLLVLAARLGSSRSEPVCGWLEVPN